MLDALGRVPGVGEARLFSQYDYSMRIWLDIERLTNLGLIPADVVDAIGAQNVLAPVGRIGAQPMPDDQQLEIVLQAKGRLTDVEEFRRSEEHTSELQSLMRISYADFCLKKTTYNYRSQSTY